MDSFDPINVESSNGCDDHQFVLNFLVKLIGNSKDSSIIDSKYINLNIFNFSNFHVSLH